MKKLSAIVLAAGKGTRMKSKQHKVLHPVCGKPIIDHIVDQLAKIEVSEIIFVVGHQSEVIETYLGGKASFVKQKEQLGTAHAVMQVKPILENVSGMTLVLNGDHPLYTDKTFVNFIEKHEQSGAAASILTAHFDDATGYGRIVRNANNEVDYIVEHKDATDEERAIKEVNTGTYIFDNQKLFWALNQVKNNNAQGEYYLPDVISILKGRGERIHAVEIPDSREAMGINDRIQLAEVDAFMRQRILRQHMLNGVSILDPTNTYIETDVVIGQDTVIEPGVILRGKTEIGEGCVIGPQVDLTDVIIDNNVHIRYTVVNSSHIKSDCSIGPYVTIRPGTEIGEQVKIGCFIDIKKAKIGKNTKVSHLAYVGDADIGENVNIGCGVVTVNYNGKTKHQTTIEDNVFVGCNVNLVAPIRVGKGAYLASGSTLTEDVPENALAIARERQTTKLEYVPKLMSKLSK